MKGIFRKYLSCFIIIFLTIILNSCSAAGDQFIEHPDINSPWTGCAIPLCESALNSLVGKSLASKPILMIIIGHAWFIALISFFPFIYGTINDLEGVNHYSVTIDGKTHFVSDTRDAYPIEGSGSTERGIRWGARVTGIFLCINIYWIIYHLITNNITDLNMLYKVSIAGVIILLLYFLWNMISAIARIAMFVCWAFCSVDFILGVMITLWNIK